MIGVAAGIIALLLGVALAVVTGDPVPGVAFGIGILVGAVGSIFVVPALQRAPGGVIGAAVDDSARGWAEFHRELARARRFESPFALIRFTLGGTPDEATLHAVRDEIARGARRIDRLWVDDDDILALLPASTEIATQVMLARARSAVPALASIEPSLALFPEHGITSGALIAAVYGGDRNDAPTPIAAVRPETRTHLPPGGTLEPAGTSAEGADESVAQGG
jgi:hypothetical protein